jgi:AraC-like DNA-binding protein
VRYLTLSPAAELLPYIDHYWFAGTSADESSAGAQFPAGGVVVLFNLGPPQALLDRPQGSPTWFDIAWVSGERARPLHLASPDGARLVGIAFRPGGARPFFDRPLSEFTDRVVLLGDVWSRELLDPVLDRLRAVDAARRDAPAPLFHIVEQALLLRLDIARSVGLGLVGAAVRRLAVCGPGASVRTVAEDLGVSTRYLRRVFQDTVGLGPKTLHRVLRFQRLIGRIHAMDAPGDDLELDWSALALSCGYFDQSHMIRDFRLMTDLRPTDYVALRSLDPNFAHEEESPPSTG